MIDPPASLAAFLKEAPDSVAKGMSALSAAVSLTDEIALTLLGKCGEMEFQPEEVIDCLHACDFIIERNSEYHFEPSARAFLLQELNQNRDLSITMHATLEEVARKADPKKAGDTIPTYLTLPVGLAYHATVTDRERGLTLYRKAYTGRHTGDQWLLGVLAEEQRGLLPVYAIEPDFFQGMTAYKEERWQDAEAHFNRIKELINDKETRVEAAIALHLLGRIYHSLGRDDEAYSVLTRGLSILERIGDRRGQAHVLNSIAMAISEKETAEAEKLLLHSLKIGRELNDLQHQAEIEHSLGKLIGLRNSQEAEKHLNRSLELRERSGDLRGQAQVLQSLSKLFRKGDPAKAEEYLRKSLAIDRKRGNLRGEAQLLNSLAIVIQNKNRDEAISMLRRSIKLNKQHRNSEGMAKSLNTLGSILSRGRKWNEARAAFEEVLTLSHSSVTLSIAKRGLDRIENRSAKPGSVAKRSLQQLPKKLKSKKTLLLPKRKKRRKKRKSNLKESENLEAQASGDE
ncbi:MAG TPA: tetratricopeptide repeat protein [Pyrinomonadaceae bacterium]